jgi:phosphatidylglycerophosphatase A
MRRLGVALATVGGVGFFPIAPGTAGSAIGLLVHLALQQTSPVVQAGCIGAATLAGIWASGVAAAHFGRDDPAPVVIDEVAGQLLTLLATGTGGAGLALGFVLFRILDIVKPWPARQFERLPGGYGIMADDLMAGLYGYVLLRAAQALWPAVFGPS